jgi:hypothetical protein
MGIQILEHLVEYKIPALAQAGVDVGSAQIVLFSKAGFSEALVKAAADRGDVELVGLDALRPAG